MAARRKTHKQELKEYYAARRAEARAQKAAGTYNKEEFARQTRAGRPLTRIEQKMAAEKEYRAARRAEARAQRIAGTFDKKEFAKSRQNLLASSAEEILAQAEASRTARENVLKDTVRKNRTATKGAGAHAAASALFDMTDKAKRKELRDRLEGDESDTTLLEMNEVFLDEGEEEEEDTDEGNFFDPDSDEDWTVIFS